MVGRDSKMGHASVEGYVGVAGGRVWFKAVGNKTSKPPLLVLHGGPGVPHDYLEPLEALAEGRQVIFYDQLGCGLSDRPQDVSLWTVERFVDELAMVRSSLGLDRVHLLGQSWGTMLGVEYMLGRPAGVASMVLSAPAISAPRFARDCREYLESMPPCIKANILEKELTGDFQSKEYHDAIGAFYRKHVCRLDPWPECLNRSMAKMGVQTYLHMWGPSEFTLTGTLKNFDRVGRLKELEVRTLFTCGSYDEATPAATREYCREMPNAEAVVFEGASHTHHLEMEVAYLARVRAFLGEND